MKHYKLIDELLEDWKNLPVPGRIYIQGAKKNEIEKAEYWSMSSKEQKEENFVNTAYGELPESLSKHAAKSFLDSQTFQDIIENKLEHNPNLQLSESKTFIDAIKYYLENDDFLD